MTVFELMERLGKFPAGMEVRGLWEGITPTVKEVSSRDIWVDGVVRQVVTIDVDQQD